MYMSFFGLEELPFKLSPDPSFLYKSPKHGEALAGLSYAIRERKGFAVLTGDAGTGKTTLLSTVINQFPGGEVQSCIILNPILSAAEFLEFVLLDFGLEPVPASKAQRLWRLQEFLLKTYRENRIAILVVDEAHKLSPELLEEIRLLGNFEYGGDKFLQIVLLGQCELDAVLNREDLRQFRQRVALRIFIDPLTTAEAGDYILFRWQRAGGSGTPFTDEAVGEIATLSRGIPRIINCLCDTALSAAFAEGARIVSRLHVTDAGANLGLLKDARNGQTTERVENTAKVSGPDHVLQPEEIRITLPPKHQYAVAPEPTQEMRQPIIAEGSVGMDAVPTFSGYAFKRKNIGLLKLLARRG
jgi:general secretion pathway protein A